MNFAQSIDRDKFSWKTCKARVGAGQGTIPGAVASLWLCWDLQPDSMFSVRGLQ